MKRTRSPKRARKRRVRKPATRRGVSRRPGQAGAAPAELREIESLRADLARMAGSARAPRWNADPEDVKRSVLKLVLTLVELIRQLLERQAIRRMEARTLTPSETEAIGLALMRLEETIRELAEQFELDPEDLNFDLGPVGRLI
jgi:gas vesicle protein GvpK